MGQQRKDTQKRAICFLLIPAMEVHRGFLDFGKEVELLKVLEDHFRGL